MVPPASAYTPTVEPFEGWFEDVNEKNLVVGMADGRAAAMQLGGTLFKMSNGPGSASAALAVNNAGAIVGKVDPSPQGFLLTTSPAVWRHYTMSPIVLKDSGSANDINDNGLVVGTMIKKGRNVGFVWDLNTGTIGPLPALLGGKESAARAVNNDRVILGAATNGSAWQTVVWQFNGTNWVVQPVNGGIDGYDIDAGLGIVGVTSNKASYGRPHHAGFLATVGPSRAYAVSSNGLIVGEDQGVSPGWPQINEAFVADRSGSTTYLPLPTSNWWRAAFGQGVNSCGVVVGVAWPGPGNWFTAQPIVWNPGC